MTKPMHPVPGTDVQGLSQVQWFAGLAMQAIIAKQGSVPDKEAEREEVALWSIRMGEAMVAASKRLKVET